MDTEELIKTQLYNYPLVIASYFSFYPRSQSAVTTIHDGYTQDPFKQNYETDNHVFTLENM